MLCKVSEAACILCTILGAAIAGLVRESQDLSVTNEVSRWSWQITLRSISQIPVALNALVIASTVYVFIKAMPMTFAKECFVTRAPLLLFR